MMRLLVAEEAPLCVVELVVGALLELREAKCPHPLVELADDLVEHMGVARGAAAVVKVQGNSDHSGLSAHGVEWIVSLDLAPRELDRVVQIGIFIK